MCLDTIYVSTNFRPDWTSNIAARRPSWKLTKRDLITINYSWHELMAGSSPPQLVRKCGTLCTPRSDDLTDLISVRSDSWLGHQGAKTENAECNNSWTNGWIISKFYHGYCTSNNDTGHYTRAFDLTNFSRSQRSKFSVVAEWLGRRTDSQPEGRGFESRRRHGAVSVSRIP
jgi:hypothetical protein